MVLPARCGDWLAPPPSPRRAHPLPRHDEPRVRTSNWPPTGTQIWPPAGTFSWPRTGFLFTMADPAVNTATSLKILRQTYTKQVFNTAIPRNVDIRDAHFTRNISTSITNELKGASLYFTRGTAREAANTETASSNAGLTARGTGTRTPVSPRRPIRQRQPFDIFEDHIETSSRLRRMSAARVYREV
jgi:hypothetical protein